MAMRLSRAESKPVHSSAGSDAGDVIQAKIDRAMSAGPSAIARSAKIIDQDAQGRTVVLREGSNGFTCMPGNPNVIGEPAMCADFSLRPGAAINSAKTGASTTSVPR